jgi:hypothetical protein
LLFEAIVNRIFVLISFSVCSLSVYRKLAARCYWLRPIILATQSQPGQIAPETLSQKTHHKNRAGGVAQSVGPQLNQQYHEKRKTKQKTY